MTGLRVSGFSTPKTAKELAQTLRWGTQPLTKLKSQSTIGVPRFGDKWHRNRAPSSPLRPSVLASRIYRIGAKTAGSGYLIFGEENSGQLLHLMLDIAG